MLRLMIRSAFHSITIDVAFLNITIIIIFMQVKAWLYNIFHSFHIAVKLELT